mmetsp:Transcript_9862/g.24620  ORF Transcript_9862/g.24620 Transcript_9862/m.24620 type:complete len:177 (-) Transcript_9862:516-1046(-)|eukprot:CAMPEP_0202869066 /NCGR_PEP_ID=MMETSP1391-20130828/11777_1 /ASSEMBLY_ACC=CAM_ASM_000867 /TAXON_ID=1034604 /ORGANISM="Chlamydomonas leiostraca, Strain SAG 11-49" /LENGTH=176 /DNA_ID=CAMNT_0049549319 /DNA_START=70 /DNA_END=600 /DNA_ORIENTATION=+
MSSRKSVEEHLSSNPALAAIQRAKTQSRQSMEAARKSMDTGTRSPALGTSPSLGSPLASGLATRKSVEMPAHAPSFLAQKKDVNVFGVDDGHGDKGWWAATDAGIMNTANEHNKAAGGEAYVPDSAVAACSSKKLDFGSMFNRPAEGSDAAGAPTPAAQGGAKPAEGGEWADFKSG